MYLLLSLLLTFAMAKVYAVQTKNSNSVQSFFTNQTDVRPQIYRIESRAFSQNDATNKLNVLKKHGFDWNEMINLNGVVVYKNDSKEQWLMYETNQSRYRYNNNQIDGFTAVDTADIPSLKKTSDLYLSNLLGTDAQKFVYVNSEYEYQTLREQPQHLYSITFRYVRVTDGRQILGITNHARITLGMNKMIKAFDFTNPLLIKEREINVKIKSSAMQKYLNKCIQNPKFTQGDDGSLLPIADVDIKEANNSYFEVITSNQRMLYPHISFYTHSNMTDGRILKRELHFIEDAESVENASQDDIINYLSPKK